MPERMQNGQCPSRFLVEIHGGHYNFARIHKTLRITPAMAAGIADHVWTIAELFAAE